MRDFCSQTGLELLADLISTDMKIEKKKRRKNVKRRGKTLFFAKTGIFAENPGFFSGISGNSTDIR